MARFSPTTTSIEEINKKATGGSGGRARGDVTAVLLYYCKIWYLVIVPRRSIPGRLLRNVVQEAIADVVLSLVHGRRQSVTSTARGRVT